LTRYNKCRDRFVLSSGHVLMLGVALEHLTGYDLLSKIGMDGFGAGAPAPVLDE
jgi:transketolase